MVYQFGKHWFSPFRESQGVRFVDSSCLQPMEVSPGGEEVGLGYQKHACVCQASIERVERGLVGGGIGSVMYLVNLSILVVSI